MRKELSRYVAEQEDALAFLESHPTDVVRDQVYIEAYQYVLNTLLASLDAIQESAVEAQSETQTVAHTFGTLDEDSGIAGDMNLDDK